RAMSSSAVAAPIPCAAPVTITTRPDRSVACPALSVIASVLPLSRRRRGSPPPRHGATLVTPAACGLPQDGTALRTRFSRPRPGRTRSYGTLGTGHGGAGHCLAPDPGRRTGARDTVGARAR